MSRLELDSRLRLSHSIISTRTHGPAKHVHAHGHGLNGGGDGNHQEKYTAEELQEKNAVYERPAMRAVRKLHLEISDS